MMFADNVCRRILQTVSVFFISSASITWAQSAATQVDFAAISVKPLTLDAIYSKPSSVAGFVGKPDDSTASAPTVAAGVTRPLVPLATPGFAPFSALAVTVKAGSTGVGVDLATPLARHLGLRSGASYFAYDTVVTEDGLHISGAMHLQNASTSLDVYPFRNSFRISPGFTWNNANRASGSVAVPGGQTFTLGNDGSATSDPANPIKGAAKFTFGHGLAPRVTMGWASLLGHHGGRVSFPVELGMQYTQAPAVKLTVSGSSCASVVYQGNAYAGCGPVDQTGVAQEQANLQSDLSPLRYYPIASLGVSFRIGRSGKGE